MLKKILAGTAALALATTATAQNVGTYLNFNIGYTQQNGLNTITVGSNELGERIDGHFGWDVFMGYNWKYDDKSTIGAEIGFGEYSYMEWNQKHTQNSIDVDQTAYLLQAVYTYNWKPKLDLIGKLGAAFGRSNINTDGVVRIVAGNFSTDATGDAHQREYNWYPMATIGFNYQLMHELAVNVMYEHIFGERIKVANADNFQATDSLMFGLKYQFDF